MNGQRLAALLLAFLTIFLSGCGSYGHSHYKPPPPADKNFTAYDVEINDFGDYWDPKAVENTLSSIENATRNSNTIVVLFAHGWHHNADPADRNRLDFHNTLRTLTSKLNDKNYADARRKLIHSSEVNVIGIFLGWRGRSLPGWFDYATFWDRKAAAERVGQGAAKEFLVRLQKLYVSNNVPQNQFMGLVVIGHSFGGQVLFKAVADAIESGLLYRDSGAKNQPVKGIGDMAVLINPALEAHQFERMRRLYSTFAYSPSQTPIFMVVSGEGDTARQILFPLGRHISRLFRPGFANEEAKALWVTALGEYDSQITHTLSLTTQASALQTDDYSENECKLLTFDFTGPTPLGGGVLAPIPDRHRPFSPVVVAYSTEELITAHNGIFKDEFRNFMIDYIAFVEGKLMLLKRRSARLLSC